MSSADRTLPRTEPAAAERATLGRTVRDLTTGAYVPRPESYGAEGWLGARRAAEAAEAAEVAEAAEAAGGEARERLAHTAERRVWAADDAAQAAQTALARAVGAYVLALCAAGFRSRAVLSAVAAAVRESVTPATAVGTVDGIMRDAGRYGVEAYFARR